MVQEVLEWVDEKIEEVDMDQDKLAIPKCFGLGAIKGFIDGAVIAYPIMLGTLLYVGHKIKKGDVIIKE